MLWMTCVPRAVCACAAKACEAGTGFTDESLKIPALPMTVTRGAAWGDFNGDSYLDLYVGGYEAPAYQPDAMLINNQGNGFSLAWTQSGDVDPARGITAADFDEDGDGWTGCLDVDCNDGNAAIHPEAPEICDGVDQDCDGYVDEDFDGDGDGWTTCHDPPDCNDGNAAVHPGATEICDGIDQNCDGIPDETFDEDGDGYGADIGSIRACVAPRGRIARGGDCDDTAPERHPGIPPVLKLTDPARDVICGGPAARARRAADAYQRPQ